MFLFFLVFLLEKKESETAKNMATIENQTRQIKGKQLFLCQRLGQEKANVSLCKEGERVCVRCVCMWARES